MTNYHTHTLFCDGKNAPASFVEIALEKGFTELGFSAHTQFPLTSDWHLSLERVNAYQEEIHRLRQRHEEQMTLLCGFEADFRPGFTEPDRRVYAPFHPDYLIGSVHYLCDGNPQHAFTIDGPVEEFLNGLQTCFHGRIEKLVEAYFQTEREMIRTCDFEILGHADLIQKPNQRLHLFSPSDDWYQDELRETVKAIRASRKIVEVNTGGMARSGLPEPYPFSSFLSMLIQAGVPLLLSADAHRTQDLDFAFTETAQRITALGGTLCTTLSEAVDAR